MLPLRPVRKKTCDPLFGGHAMGIIFLCVGLLLVGLHFSTRVPTSICWIRE